MAKTSNTPTYLAFESTDTLLERVLKAQNNIVHITQNYWALESANIGSASVPVYYNSANKNFAPITSLNVKTNYSLTTTINGSAKTFNNSANTALGTIYAPTAVGTSGQYLKSNGSGAPVWQTADSSITSTSTNLPTSKAVYDYVAQAVSGSSKYLGTASTLTDLLTSGVGYGDFYRADATFTLPADSSSETAIEIHSSDLLICKVTSGTPTRTTAGWDVVHSGDNTYRAIGNATITGSTIAVESTPTIESTNLLPLYVYGDNGITAKVSSGSSYNTLSITAPTYKYQVSGTEYTFASGSTFNIVAGSNITITAGTATNGVTPFTITAKDTTYGVATSSTLGLVKLGSDTKQTTAANAVSTTSGRSYAVQLNSSNQMLVNIPWTDTKNTVGGTSSSSSMFLVGVTATGTNPTSYASSVKVQGTTITGDVNGGLIGSNGETYTADDLLGLSQDKLDKEFERTNENTIDITSATTTQKTSYYTSTASQNYWVITSSIQSTDTTTIAKIVNFANRAQVSAKPMSVSIPLSSGTSMMTGNATTIMKGSTAIISLIVDDVQSIKITATTGGSGEIQIIMTDQPGTISTSSVIQIQLPLL